MILTDAVARMLPGVLSEEACFTEESHYAGLLEYPQYTRPEVCAGPARAAGAPLGPPREYPTVAPGPVLGRHPPQPPRLVGPGGALQRGPKASGKAGQNAGITPGGVYLARNLLCFFWAYSTVSSGVVWARASQWAKSFPHCPQDAQTTGEKSGRQLFRNPKFGNAC